MKQPGLWIAALLVMVSNAFVLIHAAINRSGEPVSALELTERELPVDYTSSEDNSGLSLSLRFQNTTYPFSYSYWPLDARSTSPGWFDQKKLEELGFDCSIPPAAPAAEGHYRRALLRTAFVALEYDGPSWPQWLQDLERKLKSMPQQPPADRLPNETRFGSRLVAIDAARDAATLRQRYPNRERVLVTRAVVRLWRLVPPPSKSGQTVVPYLAGSIDGLIPSAVHVPQPYLRQLLARIDRTSSLAHSNDFPRYTVRLIYGRFDEPWIGSLTVLPVRLAP